MIAIFFVISSCASTNQACKLQHVEKSHYATFENVEKALENKGKVSFLLFGADWCPSCKKLKELLKEDNSLEKALHINIDETWAFVLSRRLGIKLVPALVIFKNGKLSKVITDPNRILLKIIIQ